MHLFFYGHAPEADGSIGQSCLSQWWPAPFTVDGRVFATAEHYMMWRKAILFDDLEMARQILAARHPRTAKRLGRKVRGFTQEVWDASRYDIVLDACVHKFGQHPELRRFLLGTGDLLLVEAAPRDRIWGIGLAADDPRAQDPAQWRGLNLLGQALTECREILRERDAEGVAV